MKICIFCGAGQSTDPDVEKLAKQLMQKFYETGIELVYGGASIGIMGTLANELMVLGGKVTGVIPQQLMKKEIAHAGLTELHVVKDMHERKKLMYDLSDAFMVLPGGMGTLDELFEILTWRQLGLHQKPIALYNVNEYFNHLLNFLNHAVDNGLVSTKDRSLLFSSPQWDEIWEHFNKEIK